MQLLEFPYVEFAYVSSRQPPNIEVIQKYFRENKEKILHNFKDVFKAEEAFDFGVNNLGRLFETQILKNTQGKEKVVIKSNDRKQSALVFFEIMVNMTGCSQEDLDYIKTLFFHKKDNEYYFYKDVQTYTGDKVAQVIYDTWQENKSQNDVDKFKKLSNYASQGAIICIKGTDIFDNVHFKTELNPRVAINDSSKEEAKQLLNELEVCFK